MLSAQQIDEFNTNGSLLIPDFLSPDTVAEMHATATYLHQQEVDVQGTTVTTSFSTDESKHIADSRFLSSADKVCGFFEENSHTKLNKIGHALHDEQPVFAAFKHNPRLLSILRQFKYRAPVMLQSMLIFKHAKVGGKVSPHQDSTFLHTSPLSACGFWMALEQADEENGTLWFVPGSHEHQDTITRRFVRNPAYFEDNLLTTRRSDLPPNTPAVHFRYSQDQREYKDHEWVKVDVPAGGMVLLHGSVMHKSGQNTSTDRSRFAYTFHCIESHRAYSGAHPVYSHENWLQMPAGKDFTPLYIDGENIEMDKNMTWPCSQ